MLILVVTALQITSVLLAWLTILAFLIDSLKTL
jgi:hypothetical protein